MSKSETEKVLKETIQYANDEIKKNKKKYLKIIIISVSIIVLLFVSYLLVFKLEMPVKYSKNMVDVSVGEDTSLQININLKNYKSGNAILVKTGDDTYDLYINITQTLATKIFSDSDKSNNIIRVGNNMIVDFQTESLREYIPNGNGTESIKSIYYINDLSSKIATMTDDELINYKDKTLIWQRD